MKLSTYAKNNSVTYRTAWNHWKSGKITGKQLPTGTIVLDNIKQIDKTKVCIYARVSSSENKDNLEKQAQRLTEYCIAKGYQIIKTVKEIGSGVNDNRKQLNKLLDDLTFGTLIVEHKDRLTRFGFRYLENAFKNSGRQIEVVNLSENGKEDLMQDFVSIITSFCARLYGLRRTKRCTEKLIKELSKK